MLSIYDLGSSATWVGGNLAILWSLTVKLKHYQSISYSMSQNCQFPTTVTQPRLLCCGVTAMDNQQVTLLALLDLSAVFHCVDHDILLSRLQSSFSLGGITVTWIRSLLIDRSQRVLFNGSLSTEIMLMFGVPQGSVLAPLLFLLYAAQIFDTIASFRLFGYTYADDSQLYISSACQHPNRT